MNPDPNRPPFSQIHELMNQPKEPSLLAESLRKTAKRYFNEGRIFDAMECIEIAEEMEEE